MDKAQHIVLRQGPESLSDRFIAVSFGSACYCRLDGQSVEVFLVSQDTPRSGLFIGLPDEQRVYHLFFGHKDPDFWQDIKRRRRSPCLVSPVSTKTPRSHELLSLSPAKLVLTCCDSLEWSNANVASYQYRQSFWFGFSKICSFSLIQGIV